jgi:hypothetical protein
MDTNQILNQIRRNKQEMLSSAILAKAAIRMEDGAIRIVTVQALSTKYEFYQVYQTKSKTGRAPRKGWKHLHKFARDLNTINRPYSDFPTFVAYYANIHHGQVLSVRVLKSRRLAQVFTQTAHETITHNWQAAPQKVVSYYDVEKVNRKFQSKLAGHVNNDWRR